MVYMLRIISNRKFRQKIMFVGKLLILAIIYKNYYLSSLINKEDETWVNS